MTIVKLEPSKRVDERWLCWLEDGSIIRATENEVVAFALYAGMEVSDELYDRLTEAAGRSAVRAKAVDYISHRPMSRKELTYKLTARPGGRTAASGSRWRRRSWRGRPPTGWRIWDT